MKQKVGVLAQRKLRDILMKLLRIFLHEKLNLPHVKWKQNRTVYTDYTRTAQIFHGS